MTNGQVGREQRNPRHAGWDHFQHQFGHRDNLAKYGMFKSPRKFVQIPDLLLTPSATHLARALRGAGFRLHDGKSTYV